MRSAFYPSFSLKHTSQFFRFFFALLAIVFFTSAHATAQQLDWLLGSSIGNSSALNTVRSVVVAPTQQIIVAGSFADSIQFNNSAKLMSRGDEDIFLASVNSASAVNWIMQIGGAGEDRILNGLAIDGGGKIYLTGVFTDSIWLGNQSLVSTGDGDVFIAALSPGGSLLWWKQIKSAGPDYSYDIAVDGSGYVYVAGQYGDTADFGDGNLVPHEGNGDAFLARYDGNGQLSWVKTCQSPAIAQFTGVATGPDGKAYAAGMYGDYLAVGGVMYASSGYEDGFVMKVDSSGAIDWVKRFGGIGQDRTGEITVLNQHVYVSGTFYNVLQMDTASVQSEGYSDVYLAAISTSGGLRWIRSYGSADYEILAGGCMSMSAAGEVLLTGFYSDDLQIGSQTLATTNNGYDAFAVVVDSAGSVKQLHRLYGPGDDYSYAIAGDNLGNIYVGGKSMGVSMGMGNQAYSRQGGSFFLAKIKPDVNAVPGVADGEGVGVEVFPNPANGEFVVASQKPFEHVSVMDISGRVVYVEEMPEGRRNHKILMQGVPDGVYTVQVVGRGFREFRKLVVSGPGEVSRRY